MATQSGVSAQRAAGGPPRVPPSPPLRVAPQDQPRRKSFLSFCRLVRKSHEASDTGRDARKVLRDHYGSQWSEAPVAVTKAAMGETSGSVGGYLTPTEFSSELLEGMAEHSFLYSQASVWGMSSRTFQVPNVDTGTLSGTAGVPSFYGGMNFLWGSEQAPKETEPKFQQVELTAWDLLGYSVCSNQFLWDLTDDGRNSLTDMVSEAAAWFLEYAFLNGKGAGQSMPLGILNAPGAITQAAATPGTFALTEITNLTSQLLPKSWKKACWACSPSTLAKVQALTPYFINIELTDWQSAYGRDGQKRRRLPKPAGVLSTLPLYITDKLPAYATNAVGPLILLDPSMYLVGLRNEVMVDFSQHPNFTTNQTLMRVWLRADGKPRNAAKIPLQDQSTNVSPFVVLKA